MSDAVQHPGSVCKPEKRDEPRADQRKSESPVMREGARLRRGLYLKCVVVSVSEPGACSATRLPLFCCALFSGPPLPFRGGGGMGRAGGDFSLGSLVRLSLFRILLDALASTPFLPQVAPSVALLRLPHRERCPPRVASQSCFSPFHDNLHGITPPQSLAHAAWMPPFSFCLIPTSLACSLSLPLSA